MDNPFHNFDTEPGYWIRPGVRFEEYFNSDIPSEKIKFARHYVESKMGYDLSEDSLIDFSAIGIKLFGCMVADIVLEYEEYHKEKSETGFKNSPPDEE
jgi:hypothetical protein